MGPPIRRWAGGSVAEIVARLLVEALAGSEGTLRFDEVVARDVMGVLTPAIYGYGTTGNSVLAERNVLSPLPSMGQSTAGPATSGAVLAGTPIYPGRALMPDIGKA